MTTLATETFTRTYDFTQLPDTDGLTLEGYAAVFDSPTRIANAYEGDFMEKIVKGAFARAVRQQPGPVVQFDHGQHPLLGSIPIAALTSMREDDKGLYVSARIHDNWLTEPVRDAIKSKAISGMSFRFRPAPGGEEWNATRDERTLTDVDVFELGPVVFPAYEGTAVSVRSQKLAAALQDEEIRHDLALALLLEPAVDGSESDRPVEGPSDEDEPRNTAGPEDTPPLEGGQSEASAPNPARVHALTLEARLSRVLQRSIIEPPELPVD